MYISHSSKIPGQPRDELQWEEEEEGSRNFCQRGSIFEIFFSLMRGERLKYLSQGMDSLSQGSQRQMLL